MAQMKGGLDLIIETLEMRYEYDGNGRILGLRGNPGVSGFPPHPALGSQLAPLFVLGRAAEGCVWRFLATLESEVVIDVGRLAAREPGALIIDGSASAQPERLVMIERMLGPSGVGAGVENGTHHEVLTGQGRALAEL